jgi:hypothetical protein
MELVRTAAGAHPDTSVVVTARDHVMGPWIGWIPRIKILPLDDGQIRELTLKWLDDDTDRVRQFEMKSLLAPGVREIMATPLLASLVLAFYKKFDALPESITQLYEMIIDLYCGGWDLVKGVRRGSYFNGKDKRDILTRFAGMLHLIGRKYGTETELANAISATKLESRIEVEKLKESLIADSLLVRSGDKFMFSHLSFQEFLCAKDLFDPSGDRPTQALIDFLAGNDWWKEALRFYVRLNPHPEEVRAWIKDGVGICSRKSVLGELEMITARSTVLLSSSRSGFG